MRGDVRDALRRALWACTTLVSLPSEEQSRLLRATAAAEIPAAGEVKKRLRAKGQDDKEWQDIFADEVRKAYVEAAVGAGFSEEHGLAVLEYSAILQEIGENE